jgi:hypothetical protein
VSIPSIIQPGLGFEIIPEISQYDFDAWNGRLLLWEGPEAGESYAMGVDPAEGVGRDRSVCEVIKIGNLYHPDVQVAEFACDYMDPTDFAARVNAIGQLFKDSEGTEAFCTVEVNAPCGDVMVTTLRARMNYNNLYIWKAYDRINNVYTNKFGWWTNRTTRPKIIAGGLHAFQYGDLIVNSEHVLDEMEDFERDHNIATGKARSGTHDDRIMALLIGYWGAHDDEWLSGEDIAEQRRMREKGVLIQQNLATKSRKPAVDWFSLPVTPAKMYEEAEERWFED